MAKILEKMCIVDGPGGGLNLLAHIAKAEREGWQLQGVECIRLRKKHCGVLYSVPGEVFSFARVPK
jgi:hypothetical protein